MKKSKESKAISAIAKHSNMSEGKVRDEMQYAIDMAMENDNFAKIFGEGVRPSPEEFIRVISDTVKCEFKKK